MKLWKCLNDKKRSQFGNLPPWERGVWRKHEGPVKVYRSGFHASRDIISAMYGFGNIKYICLVDVRGDRDCSDYYEAWSEMQVYQMWEWTKENSVALALYAAELVYDVFEEACPLDDRPWRAIFSAKRWFRNPTEENRKEAEKAAKAASEIGWVPDSEFDKKYEPAFYAAAAARYAAMTAGDFYPSIAANHALDAITAVQTTFSKLYHIDTREEFERLEREIRNKFHDFCLIRIKYC